MGGRDFQEGQAAEILHGLVEVVNVVASKDSFEIELVGEIANMIDLANTKATNKKAAPEGSAVPAPYRSSVKVVAGAGYQRFRTTVSAYVPIL